MNGLPPAHGGSPQLRGRSGECARLRDLVAAVRRGESQILLLRGEAGIGKSALLEALVGAAEGMQIVRASGVESEMELPFASLHQLCAPMLDGLEAIPAPHRRAIEVVFGFRSGPPPGPLLIGLAVLSLVSEAAEERPLLCVIDDAQWLDSASARTLAFVARRLFAEPVGLVFAAREPGEDLRALPVLEVRGLRAGDARALLGSVLRFLLDDTVRDRLVAETHGNPLALIELPRGLTATQLAGGFGLIGAAAVSGKVQASFEGRLEGLPQDTRALLLLASAEPIGDPLLLWRAAEELGIGMSAAAAAEADGLLSVGAVVSFRHPLVRSAVYRSASVAERRAAHLALAQATDPVADPDRRAWHLAAAAEGPDERVALELEHSAGRAQSRGGIAAAAAFLERAVALTPDPERRAERAIAAAHASLNAGAFDSALGMLAAAEAGPLDELQRAQVELLRAEATFSETRGSEAPPLLLRAAKALEDLDLRLARETYLDAWSAALFAGALADPAGGLLQVSRAARAAPRPAGPRRPPDLLLDAFAAVFTEGREDAAPALREAVDAFAAADAPVEDLVHWGWLATAAAVTVWDFDSCLSISTRGVERARETGALAVLTVGVNVLAQAVALSGDLERAALLVAEADAAREATGTRVAPYGALVHAAVAGSEERAAEMIEATISEATAGGQGTAVQYALWARASILNGLGRYAEAIAPARAAAGEDPELFVSAWSLVELIEAAARSGEPELARGALERLAEHVRPAATDWALGVEARSRALLSDGEEAEQLHIRSTELLGRTPLRPELARAHLLHGEWLRRENRRVEARAQLRTAHEMLSSLGMEGFTERAHIELQATGERVRRRSVETRDELTAQERQIALLARDGLSNPEIGSRLFLSPRTVEWHLRKVFVKLGIGSRRELVKVLPESPSEALTA